MPTDEILSDMAKQNPVRKNPRLKEYGYGAGEYFVTICTQNRERSLCAITVGAGHAPPEEVCPVVRLTELGKTVQQTIEETPQHYRNVQIIKYQIMPDHVHLLLRIVSPEQGPGGACPAPTGKTKLSYVIASIKSQVSHTARRPVWQRSYYDHVIRSPADFEEIWQYIENNPLKWWLKTQSPSA